MGTDLKSIDPALLALMHGSFGKDGALKPFAKEIFLLESHVAGTSHQPVGFRRNSMKMTRAASSPATFSMSADAVREKSTKLKLVARISPASSAVRSRKYSATSCLVAVACAIAGTTRSAWRRPASGTQ